MGAPPELPGPSENELGPIETAHVPFSDESDNEMMEHDGYEPLAMHDEESQDAQNDAMGVEQNLEQQGADTMTTQFPDLPNIERAEAEIERQVWNAPRPQENNIILDEQRTMQIMRAMANVTLPHIVRPAWADDEERWKEVLLQRIRRNTDAHAGTPEDTKSEQK